MKKFVTLKDLVYVIIILSYTILLLTFSRFNDVSRLIDFIGFTGTVTGIILAVVALIYAFLQSETFGNAQSKMNDSADRIQTVSNELKKVEGLPSRIEESVEDINSKIKSSLESLNETMDQFAYSIQNIMDDRFNHIDNKLDSMALNRFGNQPGQEAFAEAGGEENFQAFVSLLPTVHIVALYYFLESDRQSKTFDIYAFVAWTRTTNLFSMMGDESQESNILLNNEKNVGILLGLLLILLVNNWIVLTGTLGGAKIVSFNPELKEIIYRKVNETNLVDKFPEFSN